MKPVRQPWSLLGEGSSAEQRAGALLRQARVPAPMTDTQLAAVRARLRRARLPVAQWTRTWQVAVALAVMLMAGVLFAAARRLWPRPAPTIAPRVVSRAVAPPVKRRRAPVREQAEAVAPPAEAPAPASAPLLGGAMPVVPRAPAAHPPAPASTATVRSPARSAASASPSSVDRSSDMLSVPGPSAAPAIAGSTPLRASPLADESRLVALALRQLRQNNDPTAALATLDEHAARYGAGALVAEADTARVEALLRLGRHAEALVRLDGMALSASGRPRGLLAARAELRAEQGRCSAASLDFDRLLAGAGEHDAIAERALHGRAACRAQAGDVAGAREDLETYLVRFPDGRFAGDARATLGR